MTFDRAAGVLLHPTSLPGPYGIGDLGQEAHRYIDWLADAGVGWWQVLPLNAPGEGHSPYSTRSTFAGNVLLVSPERLAADGLLEASDLAKVPELSPETVDHHAATTLKETLLKSAFARHLKRTGALADDIAAFRRHEAAWLEDYALFAALKRANGGLGWFDWPEALALRHPKTLESWAKEHARELDYEVFCQFLFARQWAALRAHAKQRGVKILGDLPMFVALDSAEVWADREQFLLDEHGRPTAVAGVPPDYFNENGQLWGNPLYDWEHMHADGYRWWIERVRHALLAVDALRLDHFRGFAAFWEVPAAETTAKGGCWVTGPGRKLFDALAAALGDLPFVAEDLGLIDEPVLELRDGLGLPGMAVLQFAFQPAPRSLFVPYQHVKNQVVYTGTHDNNTTRGWYEDDATPAEKDFVRRYFATDGHEIHWDLTRAAMGSVADLAIVPHQDLAGLGSDGRMNVPGTVESNWSFRLQRWMLDPGIKARLAELIWVYGRRPDQ